MRALYYLASTAIVLGCNSTLNEYQCEVAADCGEVGGRCEDSGHCSFPDESCLSGFRYGKSSGSESNACVTSVPSGMDGVDGGKILPTARIAEFSMPCGETSAVFDGSLSGASPGESLNNFAWELYGPNDNLLGSFDGAPDTAPLVNMHSLGGSMQSPRINATTYEGVKAIRYQAIGSSSPDRNSLFIQLALEGSAQEMNVEYDFSFALGVEELGTSNATGAVTIVNDAEERTLGDFVVESGMNAVRSSFEATDFPPPWQLRIVFSKSGTYWVDNVSLTQRTSGIQLISNSSVESGPSPWAIQPAAGNSEGASTGTIPLSLRQPGRYLVRLQVTDTSSAVSDFAELAIEVQDCPGS